MASHTVQLLIGLTLLAQSAQAVHPDAKIEKNYGQGALTSVPEDTKAHLFAKPADLKWFEDAKFGSFICWGPCSIVKAEIGWGRNGPRGLKQHATSGVPKEEYDNLYKRFNPTKFDADQWVKLIRDSGAKYMIFLTKHHDGFCMFDAKGTDYKITNTPFGRDVCKELADACHKYDIKIFWYYSQPDWVHPEYNSKDHHIYREYMHEHLRQLLTNYGKIAGIWFDSLGSQWQHWNTPTLVKEMRALQPGLLINDRWGYGMSGFPRGDFATPEQSIGNFHTDRPWESCATMGQGWSWKGPEHILSAKVCTRMLIQCNGSGGNLALDVGPRPDGIIDPAQAANYLAIGDWLKTNGESLYGTRAGPYKPAPYGVSTHKDNHIYIHLLAEFTGAGQPSFRLPKPAAKVLKIQTLAGETVPFQLQNESLEIDLSKLQLGEIATVLRLDIDRPASEIALMDVMPKKQIQTVKVSASSSLKGHPAALLIGAGGNKEFSAGIHRKPRWVSQYNDPATWFIIEFEQTESIHAIVVKERVGDCRIREFKLEYEHNGRWHPLHQGTEIGLDFGLLITSEVKTQKIRLNILKLSKGTGASSLIDFHAYKR